MSPKHSPHSGQRAGISSVSYSQEIAGQARNEVVGTAMRLAGAVMRGGKPAMRKEVSAFVNEKAPYFIESEYFGLVVRSTWTMSPEGPDSHP